MSLFKSVAKVSNGLNKVTNNVEKGVSAFKSQNPFILTGVNKQLDSVLNNLSKTKNSISMITRTAARLEDAFKKADSLFSKGLDAVGRVAEKDINANRISANLKYDLSIDPAKKIASQDPGKGTLQFPPDLGYYYMEFSFFKYERPNVLERASAKAETHIYLPIPANLNETHQVSWQDTSQGVIGSIANILDADNKNINAGTLASVGVANAKSIGRAAADTIGSKIGLGPAFDIVEQVNSAVPNPNISALFQGPTLRPFEFSWRFHPESPEESKTIQKICTEFRKRMLPNLRGSNALLLGYPNMVGVRLLPKEAENYLFKLKKCVITEININYSPNGKPSFFKGTSAPTMIEMTVRLKEIEYFLSEDFGGESDSTSLDLDLFDFGE